MLRFPSVQIDWPSRRRAHGVCGFCGAESPDLCSAWPCDDLDIGAVLVFIIIIGWLRQFGRFNHLELV